MKTVSFETKALEIEFKIYNVGMKTFIEIMN